MSLDSDLLDKHDPLDVLRIISDAVPMMRHEPQNISKLLRKIVYKWEEERQSHDVSIDALHDQIAELNKIITEKDRESEKHGYN